MRIADNRLYFILFVVFCLWIGIGIFPLITYESDAMHIIAGANLLCENGFSFEYNEENEGSGCVFLCALEFSDGSSNVRSFVKLNCLGSELDFSVN